MTVTLFEPKQIGYAMTNAVKDIQAKLDEANSKKKIDYESLWNQFAFELSQNKILLIS
jgi:hypothetical protein